MKKIIFLGVLILLFVGCKSKQATQLDNKTEAAIKGNWTITSVTFPGSEFIKVTSFELANSNCFVGSTWKFVSNNNKGEMVLNATGCPSFSSPITWFINKEGNFVMKILNNDKAKKIQEGYVLKVANLIENSFQLIDNINVGGQWKELTYQFIKN
ncbi:MAG: lipocalin family protein [Flavobacteriaceae bacterium]|nr:lipocalin family protein [Flavobacteriaceae bacterium]